MRACVEINVYQNLQIKNRILPNLIITLSPTAWVWRTRGKELTLASRRHLRSKGYQSLVKASGSAEQPPSGSTKGAIRLLGVAKTAAENGASQEIIPVD